MKFKINQLMSKEDTEIPSLSSSFSAGYGTPFNDGDSYEPINKFLIEKVKEPLLLVVSGDSMKPTFLHGDRLVIDFNRKVVNGDYSAVYLNGEYFIKEFNESKRGYRLLSINPEYNPIEIQDNDDFKLLGKVVGLERKFI
ncbi:MAG: S24 family peptidase [Candidatus Kapabacteria bacterium]|nr:S24 family peptidase [Candidatus Kapabacteria bacterium]